MVSHGVRMPYGNDFSDHAYCESADSESTRVPAVGRLRRSVQELAESSRFGRHSRGLPDPMLQFLNERTVLVAVALGTLHK